MWTIRKDLPSRQILVPRTSPSNVPTASLKDPIWPSRGRTNLTSWGRPEMTPKGRLNLMFKGRPWEVDLGRTQDVLRTSPRGTSEYSNLDVPYSFYPFFQNLFSWPNLSKSISTPGCIENPVKLLRWSLFCKISLWLFIH